MSEQQTQFFEALQQALTPWGLALAKEKAASMYAFFALVEETNRVMNLTAITDAATAAQRHFADALNPAALQGLRGAHTVVDLGTGAGFPGVPLALFLPQVQFVLVDSLHKRIHFLQQAKEALQLENVQLICARAEDFGRANRSCADVVLSRAVAPMRVLAEYALPILRTQGRLLAWKGPAAQEELSQAQQALRKLGGDGGEILPYTLPNAPALNMVQVKKLHPTPPQYPRANGTPAKKPL